ncbi:hypothetical protein NK983_33295, partial [Salmonella enterica subsp. enterica serovar Typhimurium]|nr:hypothetical protein [Salmonella enterica subsp. enterica serovar Typhimurium]
YCNGEVAAIDSLTKANGGYHFLVPINNVSAVKTETVTHFPHLFEGMRYHVPPIERKHYREDDAHYNNEGHKIHADFIDSLI